MIEARGLGKSFGQRRAVDDLSFDVRPGVVTGFLGPNGSGKSTTMRLMLGLDRGEGRTTFTGRTFAELDHPARHVGAVLDARSFHPTRSAARHLRMLAAAAGLPASRADEVLDLVGLADVASDHPRGFSLGMAQRLGLAAALLGDPKALLLDEPSNGLDPQGITWLRSLLKHLAGEGRAVLVSSHLLQEMGLLADELVVIGRGRLIATGPVSKFLGDSALASVVVRSPDQPALISVVEAAGGSIEVDGADVVVRGLTGEQVGDAVHAAGIRLHQLTDRTPTLEEAFLAATGDAEEFRARGADS